MSRAPAFSAALLACAAGALGGEGRTITVGEHFDGGAVSLAPGDELAVRLPATAGAGYSWTTAFVDTSVLKPLGPASPELAAGPSGSQVLRFEAVSAGSTGLGLAYRRPSEASAPADRLFRVQASVRADAGRRTLALAEPDDGSRVYVVQGDSIVVRLPSNVTTGYSWSISQRNPAVLQPVGQPRYEAPPGKAAAGAPGVQVFEFRVAGAGGAWLQLSYRRPFEKDAPPARTWNVFVAAAGS